MLVQLIKIIGIMVLVVVASVITASIKGKPGLTIFMIFITSIVVAAGTITIMYLTGEMTL